MDLFDKTPDPRPTRRFDDRFLDTLAAQDGVGGDGREVVEEYHLDCQGNKRLFRLEILGSGPDAFLSATEVRAGAPTGITLRRSFHEGAVPVPWGELRGAIDERLATRDLVRDPDCGELQVLYGRLRLQLRANPGAPDGPPGVLVDDQFLSWEELGRLLAAYEGWGLDVRITEE
jgi:hypothetical protein